MRDNNNSACIIAKSLNPILRFSTLQSLIRLAYNLKKKSNY